ncbi:Ubiquinone biosynthesis protein [Nowakowskiella sp. JEL0078]|nr:Ubiquinone biosynthesis protein [Nowakowskiella sp. JEL0078]
MLLDPVGRRILRERPVINTQTLDLDRLRRLPVGTFGKEYVNFLDDCHVSPDTRTEVKFLSDPELAYVMQRYREVHDFWHVMTGFSITEESEIALKWFEMVQTGLPVASLSAFVGPLRLSMEERGRLFSEYVPWALQCGSNCKFLMNVMYEDLLEEKMDDVNRMLGFWRPVKSAT